MVYEFIFSLSPMIMEMEKWLYLKGNDPIGDTPIFDFYDYGRMCVC